MSPGRRVRRTRKPWRDSQIHVLSHDDAGVAKHDHLHPVEAVLKKNVVHGTEVGAVIGVIGGSGVYDIDGLENTHWEKVASPFGEPSDELLFGAVMSKF